MRRRWHTGTSEQSRADNDVLHEIKTLPTGSSHTEETSEVNMLKTKAITFPHVSTHVLGVSRSKPALLPM